MEYVKERCRVVYLQIAKETIVERVVGNTDRESRIVGLKGRGINDLIEERIPLYEQYADVVVNLDGCELDEAVMRVVNACRV
jgi:shikimate kinase